MKTLKIYNIIATIFIVVLSFCLYNLKKELKETEQVLEQCSERYYQELNK